MSPGAGPRCCRRLNPFWRAENEKRWIILMGNKSLTLENAPLSSCWTDDAMGDKDTHLGTESEGILAICLLVVVLAYRVWLLLGRVWVEFGLQLRNTVGWLVCCAIHIWDFIGRGMCCNALWPSFLVTLVDFIGIFTNQGSLWSRCTSLFLVRSEWSVNCNWANEKHNEPPSVFEKFPHSWLNQNKQRRQGCADPFWNMETTEKCLN